MSFRGFSFPQMLTVSGPWVTPDHPERLLLLSLLGTVGMVRFVDAVHGDVLAFLSAEERARLGLLTDSAGLKDLRHDTLARIVWYCLLAHEYLHGSTPAGQAVTDLKTVLFPDNLNVVRVGYRESAGRARARASQLTDERREVLTDIPVQGGNLLGLVEEWNRVGVEMGEIQDQRVTPRRSESERSKHRATRSRWVRVVNTLIGSLQLEAEENPAARRILDRVAAIQAEVRRQRAADGTPDDDDDGDEGEDGLEVGIADVLGTALGQAPQVLDAPVAANR
ncbi:MAG TPA: hypothetical protein VNM90_21215 [Haliangium sp.]|nr:hypothetical protein [Haliangium sp.]